MVSSKQLEANRANARKHRPEEPRREGSLTP